MASVNHILTNPLFHDLTDQVFGRWTVLRYSRSAKRTSFWMCRCECGTVREVAARNLKRRTGASKSCGCLWKEAMARSHTIHGQYESPEYVAWQHMKMRCENASVPGYRNYGGRGISVCQEWSESFQVFYRDMGPRPSAEHSIDRFPDNDGNYEPGNCRWATKIEQMNNFRRNRKLALNGESHTLSEWARILGIAKSTIRSRRDRGLPVEQILSCATCPAYEARESHV